MSLHLNRTIFGDIKNAGNVLSKSEALEILNYLLKLSKTNFVSKAGYDVILQPEQIEEIIKRLA